MKKHYIIAILSLLFLPLGAYVMSNMQLDETTRALGGFVFIGMGLIGLACSATFITLQHQKRRAINKFLKGEFK